MLNTTNPLSIFVFVSSIFAGSAAANEIADGQINVGFGPATIINHPSCQLRGDTALQISMKMENVFYRAGGESWEGAIDIWPKQPGSRARFGGEQLFDYGVDGIIQVVPKSRFTRDEPAELCFREERRGVEVVRFEVPCSTPQGRRDLIQLIQDHAPRVDLSATATICQSLTSFRVVEGQWQAEVTIGDDTQTTMGTLLPQGGYQCGPLQDGEVARGGGTYLPAATYSMPGAGGDELFLSQPSIFRLWIENIPIVWPGAEELTTKLDTAAAFFPFVEGLTPPCRDGECRASTRRFRSPGGWSWSACGY